MCAKVTNNITATLLRITGEKDPKAIEALMDLLRTRQKKENFLRLLVEGSEKQVLINQQVGTED